MKPALPQENPSIFLIRTKIVLMTELSLSWILFKINYAL